jgi:peptide/nickel transport system ATP-binding protein
MYLGEIVEVAPAEALFDDPKHPYTQVLKWAATDLDRANESADLPVRGIDIPDPVDPPSGCRFHTRCPYAREICRETSPDLGLSETSVAHDAACFRIDQDHDYWDSPPLYDETDGRTQE